MKHDSRHNRAMLVGLFAFLLTGCNSTSIDVKEEIEDVIREDQRANRKVYVDGESVEPLAGEVAKKMRAIDTSKCPGDFRVAYLQHTRAWERKGQAVDLIINIRRELLRRDMTAKEAEERQFVAMFEDKDVAELTEMLAEVQRESDLAGKQIGATFERVEDAAVMYGAQLDSQVQSHF